MFPAGPTTCSCLETLRKNTYDYLRQNLSPFLAKHSQKSSATVQSCWRNQSRKTRLPPWHKLWITYTSSWMHSFFSPRLLSFPICSLNNSIVFFVRDCLQRASDALDPLRTLLEGVHHAHIRPCAFVTCPPDRWKRIFANKDIQRGNHAAWDHYLDRDFLWADVLHCYFRSSFDLVASSLFLSVSSLSLIVFPSYSIYFLAFLT